jgi:preprotein translocase subunit Sss1
VEFAEGKPEQALETLQEALNILAAAKSPERERWQKEWEKLSAKIKEKN